MTDTQNVTIKHGDQHKTSIKVNLLQKSNDNK